MNLKEELKKMRDRLSEIPKEQLKTDGTEEKRIIEGAHKFSKRYISIFDKVSDNNIKNIDLDDKVDNFIDWYFENMIKGHYTDVGEFQEPNDMRNFIEKMAVWYELRYPDYEVNKLMHCCSQEKKNINEEMFVNNPMTSEMINGSDTLWSEWSERILHSMHWDDFYNAKAFINSLPDDEKKYLLKAKYSNFAYIDSIHSDACLYLTSNGFVDEARGFEKYTNYKIKDSELKGMHIKDVVKLMDEKGISLPDGNGLEENIKFFENLNYQKDEMLNCVMYRIIERGGNRIGPRRALLFAKEFGRNIDIPMMYGVDYSDPGLREFVNEYIKAGGFKDLLCYEGYFSRANKEENMNTVSVRELIKDIDNDCVTKYTPEETALHQRFVNALSNQIDREKLKKEEVQQLRLQRKLNKSRNNKKTI